MGGSTQATATRAIFSGFHGETYNCPAEVAETRYGLYVDRLAINDAPGGEGAHRGGKGIVVEYRVRNDGCFFTCAYTRNKHLPWSAEGGLEGAPNVAEVIRTDGTREEYAVVTALTVNEGDVIRIRTGSGGGYGNVRQRDIEAIQADIQNELITPQRARAIYGYDGD